MKLPEGLKIDRYDTDRALGNPSLIEAVVRDCAKVCEKEAKKQLARGRKTDELLCIGNASDILARYGLTSRSKE